MNHFKLDYTRNCSSEKKITKKNRMWATSIVISICILCFTLLLFGGIGTAFQHRNEHKSLRERHDDLRLRYDSLFAAKLQTEKQLGHARAELQQLQQIK